MEIAKTRGYLLNFSVKHSRLHFHNEKYGQKAFQVSICKNYSQLGVIFMNMPSPLLSRYKFVKNHLRVKKMRHPNINRAKNPCKNIYTYKHTWTLVMCTIVALKSD